MRKLGISLYPEHSTFEKDKEYLTLASKYGFTRIFTCLLSVTKDIEEVKKDFKRFSDLAHSLGFEIAVDTNEQVFKKFGATPLDIKPFQEIGVDIIRLDGHYSVFEDVALTRNTYGIKIEFNASFDVGLKSLVAQGANVRNMSACHNFYPQRYSGISQRIFEKCNHRVKEIGINLATFISSQQKNTFGPWKVYEGLPTLESHRNLPIDAQLRHIIACEDVDDIIIGNAYASEEELRKLSETVLDYTTIKVDFLDYYSLSNLQKEVLFDDFISGREDASEYYIRSKFARSKFKEESVPYIKSNKDFFDRGDILMVNDNLKHYRGDIEIVLKKIENDGQRNYLGHVSETDMLVLDELEKRPHHLFKIIK